MAEEEDLYLEDFGEIMEEENLDLGSKDPEEIRRKIEVVEEELQNLSDVEWGYAKRLLKYGLAAWVFGLSVFLFSLVSFRGPEILWGAPPLTFSLLIIAGAAPVIFTSFFIQRYRKEKTDLGKIRGDLLNNYEKMLLKKLEEDIR